MHRLAAQRGFVTAVVPETLETFVPTNVTGETILGDGFVIHLGLKESESMTLSGHFLPPRGGHYSFIVETTATGDAAFWLAIATPPLGSSDCPSLQLLSITRGASSVDGRATIITWTTDAVELRGGYEYAFVAVGSRGNENSAQ